MIRRALLAAAVTLATMLLANIENAGRAIARILTILWWHP